MYGDGTEFLLVLLKLDLYLTLQDGLFQVRSVGLWRILAIENNEVE